MFVHQFYFFPHTLNRRPKSQTRFQADNDQIKGVGESLRDSPLPFSYAKVQPEMRRIVSNHGQSDVKKDRRGWSPEPHRIRAEQQHGEEKNQDACEYRTFHTSLYFQTRKATIFLIINMPRTSRRAPPITISRPKESVARRLR